MKKDFVGIISYGVLIVCTMVLNNRIQNRLTDEIIDEIYKHK